MERKKIDTENFDFDFDLYESIDSGEYRLYEIQNSPRGSVAFTATNSSPKKIVYVESSFDHSTVSLLNNYKNDLEKLGFIMDGLPTIYTKNQSRD